DAEGGGLGGGGRGGVAPGRGTPAAGLFPHVARPPRGGGAGGPQPGSGGGRAPPRRRPQRAAGRAAASRRLHKSRTPRFPARRVVARRSLHAASSPSGQLSRGARWALVGVAAGVIAAGMWGLWRREPGQVRMATTVHAPIERVFDAWSRFQDFPRFMPMVAEVRPAGEERWHWVIAGPAGAPIEFDSIVTRRDRPRLIEWTSADGAVVEHSGSARFRPTADAGTRVEISMSWRPVGGGTRATVPFMSRPHPYPP